MATRGSPAVARHRLRLALRRRRGATGRTRGDIAKSLDWSISKLQRSSAGLTCSSTPNHRSISSSERLIGARVSQLLPSPDRDSTIRLDRWRTPLALRPSGHKALAFRQLQKGTTRVNAPTTSLVWQRSGRCDTSACVEVAFHEGDVVLRDSKNPDGPVLHFTRQEWEAFVAGVEDGDFHLFD
jgi:Domain of unknown function (DUF397)